MHSELQSSYADIYIGSYLTVQIQIIIQELRQWKDAPNVD